MTLPPVSYVTMNSVVEGVGVSQVLAYVKRLAAREVIVRLHSFEPNPVEPASREALSRHGVEWVPHSFGRGGSVGGLRRVARAATALRGSELVHARSDLAAAATMLAGVESWVWDVRSLWRDQRVALGALNPRGAEALLLNAVEGRAATRSSRVISLSEAVLPVLEQRHHVQLASKAMVITTCVDTQHFGSSAIPARDPLVMQLSGTLNTFYDVPTMVRLVQLARRRWSVDFNVVSPGGTPWDGLLDELSVRREVGTYDRMPQIVAGAHVGLSVCRLDAGVSLRASMPTKIGEYLAVGRPVIVNAGLGDADTLIAAHGAGVVVRDTSDDALEDVLDQLEALLDDPATAARCRRLAEDHFDLDVGVDRLIETYKRALEVPHP